MVAGLRERKKEQTREALVRSAMTLFDERGFDQVTVEEIAESCDVSPRTFFRYFSSKDDVVFAHGQTQKERIIELLRERDPSTPLLEALRDAVAVVADTFKDERDLIVLRHRIAKDTPSLQGRLAENNHGWEATILAEVRPKGRLDAEAELRLRLTVAAAMTALRVATETWIERGGRGDLTSLLTSALDHLRDGI